MAPHSPRTWEQILRPRVFFPLLLAAIAFSVLMSPRNVGDTGVPKLSSRSTSPGGASGFAQAARRLGWRVSELNVPFSDTLSTRAVYAVLTDDEFLTSEEMHVMLDRVRAGASLLLLAGGPVVRDSLHVRVRSSYGDLIRTAEDSVACPERRSALRRLASPTPFLVNALAAAGALRHDTVHIATARIGSTRDSVQRRPYAAMIGMSFGHGRIALASTPSLFANDVIRECERGAAVAAVRALEWLSARDAAPALRHIVFDEYHQGYGTYPSVMRAMRLWTTQTPSGRTALQLAIAALILLAASAPRAIPPVARASVQRRSPLEHVSALAGAYEQVRASRTAVRLLVQGLRRRMARLTQTRRVSDEQFLDALAARHPALATDVTRISRALTTPVDAAELLSLAATIDRIERSTRT